MKFGALSIIVIAWLFWLAATGRMKHYVSFFGTSSAGIPAGRSTSGDPAGASTSGLFYIPPIPDIPKVPYYDGLIPQATGNGTNH